MGQSEQISVGVVETGGMGGMHAENLHSRVAGARLAAVADLDTARAEKLTGRSGAAVYRDAVELIRDDNVEAIIVASPDPTHAPLVLECLEVEKPVLCEKPLATSADAAFEVLEAEVELERTLVRVDGLLGSPDIIEDLALLGALDEKIVIGSMNRGGLAGAVFELDDRFTGYTAEAIVAAGLDGGKMLLRIADDDPGTLPTLTACAEAVDALAARGLMAMIEPFAARRENGKAKVVLDPDATIRAIGIASALGATSAYTWLKLPVIEEMERVMAATTLPTLLLGGTRARTRGRRSRAGEVPCRSRRSGGWWQVGRCCTRATAMWPVLWTRPRPSSPKERGRGGGQRCVERAR